MSKSEGRLLEPIKEQSFVQSEEESGISKMMFRSSKRLVGRQLEDAPDSADLWAVTINYVQEREAACDLIHTLKAGGACFGGNLRTKEMLGFRQCSAAILVMEAL